LILLIAGCGGGSSSQRIVGSVTLSPSTAQTLAVSQSLPITATVANDASGSGVSWTLTGVGSLSDVTTTSVTYTAPSAVSSSQTVTVRATSKANPAASATLQITVTSGGAQANVLSLSVNGGPVPGQLYANGAFANVTLCVPGTSNCQTIGGVLVDTGSFGLRLLKSAVTLPLAPLTSGGSTINNCVQFVDGSFLWGQVAAADVHLAGEQASSVSVQLIADPTGFAIPTSCAAGGSNNNSLAALGANGILGVGTEAQDCGPACDSSSGRPTPPVPAYYNCSTSGGCQPAFVSLAEQITNPVVKFPVDNNGVLVQMQSLSGTATTASGNLIFGIGTQANNALGSATIQTLNNVDNFTTAFNSRTLTSSFVDSGSNGLFFPDSAIATFTTASGFFCPPSTLHLTAVNHGQNGTQTNISFTVDNAQNLFNSNPSAAAFSTLAGPMSGGFDWGLPFFYGRNVFTSIRGQTMPSGAPAAPWWAY